MKSNYSREERRGFVDAVKATKYEWSNGIEVFNSNGLLLTVVQSPSS